MRRFFYSIVPVLAFIIGAGCASESNPIRPDPGLPPNLTVLALGDSYTVGQGVPPSYSWPAQLADSLAAAGDTLQALNVVAQTGWTTRDLLDALRDTLPSGTLQPPYGLVTLMIGVNNQFQGGELGVFEAELDTLLDLAIGLAGGDPERVLGFSIPDYGVTPVGELFGPEQISSEIQTFNLLLGQVLADRAVTLLDITTLSLQAADDPSLVARDGLHFSREMYRHWVAMMLPYVIHILGQ